LLLMAMRKELTKIWKKGGGKVGHLLAKVDRYLTTLPALKDVGENEGEESINDIFKELAMDAKKFPAEALEGSWI
jgi:hypothetical protein